MNFVEETVEERVMFEGKILRVRQDIARQADGLIVTRDVVDHNGGVCILPITDEGEVILVRQFRYPYKEELLEIPAGRLEKGEDPYDCGVRELKEEVGATAEEVVSLGHMYPTPGYVNEKIYMYAAKGLSFGENDLDEGEQLSVEKYPIEKALEMIKTGEIIDAKTIIALMKVAFLLKD